MNPIKRLVIHCSDSAFGNAALIDQWHRQRGFSKIGYHFVILNGYPDSRQYQNRKPWNFLDGTVECGRNLDTDPYLSEEEVGAHVYGFNQESIGICLIGGKSGFTSRQFHTLRELVNELLDNFHLPISAVFGHYELNQDKTCPDINMEDLRRYLADDHIKPLLNQEG
ncbi:MAG: N-acetylmuramoyl-L-alanine amidase [Candidatus Schekmanbacteria bacterium]|nr:N-acetylmuramoyl-L-alanine amidase [Candidatus Schekmanbacteria bacterium]